MSVILPRILIIDDHPLIRAGLHSTLSAAGEWAICGEAGTRQEAKHLVTSLKPDIAVLDLMLGDQDGLTLIQELLQLSSSLKIVVLSMLRAEEYAPRALAAGAVAFVNKADGPHAILNALRALKPGALADANGNTIKSPIAKTVPESPITRLSDRELQVFTLIGQGRTTKEISVHLGVSPKTIDAHKEHIKDRLGLGNAAQLTAAAARWSAAERFISQSRPDDTTQSD
jgi:DNA-binding NarL/FixJ family response regulator